MVAHMRLVEYLLREKLKGRNGYEFAEKVGISTGHLHQIKFGKSAPRIDVAVRIVEVSGGVVTLDDLLADAPKSQQEAA